MYPILKHSHMSLVLISIILFQIRFWLFALKNKPKNKFLNIAPHIIDTLLLASGLTMAITLGFSPSNSPWLMYKLIALVGYIGFGIMAMKAKAAKRWIGFFAAMLCFVYMLMAATTKNPTFFM